MSQYENYYGGGGFIAGGGGSPFGGGSPSGGPNKTEAAQSLRPLVCRQILQCKQAHSDAPWMLGDQEVGQVTTVGQVVSINKQATNTVYWIDDGTARVEARHWVDSSSDAQSDQWADIVENTIVRLTGSLKNFGSRQYLTATHIRLLKEPDELFYHFSEVMHTDLVLSRGPPPKPGQEMSQGQYGLMGNQSSANAYSAQTNMSYDTAKYGHLTPEQLRVVMFMKSQPPSDGGYHVTGLVRAVGGKDANAASNVIDSLTDAGLIYTTFDDMHYMLAE